MTNPETNPLPTEPTEPCELKEQTEISYNFETSSSLNPMLLALKVIEYSSLSAVLACAIIGIFSPENHSVLTPGASALGIFTFFFLLNRKVFENSQNAATQYQLEKKAELYMLSNNSFSESHPLAPARAKALQYCQELIGDYKRTRTQARYSYYVLQLSTIVFSGITPILVLVDKLEAGQTWLKWLPVICPAIASIVASVVTSFPFQENAVSANTTVELLEAEQEKFILGVSPLYRCYDASDDSQQEQKAKQAIENFINEVNNIHLKQVQQQQGTETQNSPNSNESNAGAL
jgi:hypothetical protein